MAMSDMQRRINKSTGVSRSNTRNVRTGRQKSWAKSGERKAAVRAAYRARRKAMGKSGG